MVGILYICTGKYSVFWENFYKSAEHFFLTAQDKTYFVFTDADHIYAQDAANVKKIDQKSLGWPYNTLLRFDIFLKIEAELQKCDYIFFINANTILVDYVNEDIFPGKNNDGLVGVNHPYFWNKLPEEFSYERNEKSAAYIKSGDGKYYFMGAFNGGQATPYLELIRHLQKMIIKDLEKGIIAIWWDESHLNHYLLDKNPLVLSPAYCYPDQSTLPFSPKLVILDKLKFGGHSFLRNG